MPSEWMESGVEQDDDQRFLVMFMVGLCLDDGLPELIHGFWAVRGWRMVNSVFADCRDGDACAIAVGEMAAVRFDLHGVVVVTVE